MDVHEQAEAMVSAWTEGQKKIWQSWCEASRAVLGTPGSSTSIPGPFPGLVDQWCKLALSGLEEWRRQATPVTAGVADSVLAGTNRIMRLVELSTSALRAAVPSAEAGGDWQNLFRQYVDQLQAALVGLPQEPIRAAEDLGTLSQLFLDELGGLQRSWFEAVRPAAEPLRGPTAGDDSALIRFADRYWDAYERTIGRVVQSPSVGYTRELNTKLLKALNSWLEFRRAGFQYEIVLADGWARGWDQFLHEIVTPPQKGIQVRPFREVLRLWGETTDRVLTEVFRSEEYARTQGRLVNAAMAYRLCEREVVDVFLKTSHLPTRSEVDEASRSIYELRKGLRDVQRALREAEARASHQGEQGQQSAGSAPRRVSEARSRPRRGAGGKDQP